VAIDPDRPAVQKLLNRAAQIFHKMFGAGFRKTNQVDDGIRS
jgi:hypothetical protein